MRQPDGRYELLKDKSCKEKQLPWLAQLRTAPFRQPPFEFDPTTENKRLNKDTRKQRTSVSHNTNNISENLKLMNLNANAAVVKGKRVLNWTKSDRKNRATSGFVGHEEESESIFFRNSSSK